MKTLTYSVRTGKEVLRDPLTLLFGLGFPLVLLFLLSAIQANVPVSMFEIETLIPGISVFGLSFMTLFSSFLISKDRGSAFLQRLYTTPMKPTDYILGYTLPIIAVSILQTVICYLAAFALGLEFSVNVFWAVILNIPTALLYTAMGLLFGSVLSEKQVGGICGALVTNLSAWLSGIWFELELVGGWFEKLANVLPFVHGVEVGRAALSGNYAGIFPHLAWVTGYAVVIIVLAVLLFLRQMKE